MTYRRLPPLLAVRAFEAAARHLSITRAAGELSVTPGAVSRQVRELEARIGAELFVRGPAGLRLTPAGAVLFDAARDGLDLIAGGALRARRAAVRQVLHVGAYAVFASRWLIPRLQRFYARHGDLDVELATTVDPLELPPHRFDAVITVSDGTPVPGFQVVPIVPIVCVPVCAPALLAAGTFDLRRQRLLHAGPRPHDWQRWLAAAGIADVDPLGGSHFESIALATEAAAEGLGVAMAIRALVEGDLARGRLVVPIAVERRTSRAFVLMHDATRAREPGIVAFRAWLTAEAAGDAGQG